MTPYRPFRFGVQIARGVAHGASRSEWKDKAQRAEALGYDILLMPDHLTDQFALGPALALARRGDHDAAHRYVRAAE